MSDTFIIETSARHVHLSQEHLEILFGAGAVLTRKKDLSQPGQYACEERVTVVGPKRELSSVIVLGPVRPCTQVELSATDARNIGVAASLRESGDIAGSAGCKLIGPCGEVDLTEGVIVAKRHIHMTQADAELLGVRDRQNVWVLFSTGERTAALGDVICRVSEQFSLAMHIDTDEANAVGAVPGTVGRIIPAPFGSE